MTHKAYKHGFGVCGARPGDGKRTMINAQVGCQACRERSAARRAIAKATFAAIGS